MEGDLLMLTCFKGSHCSSTYLMILCWHWDVLAVSPIARSNLCTSSSGFVTSRPKLSNSTRCPFNGATLERDAQEIRSLRYSLLGRQAQTSPLSVSYLTQYHVFQILATSRLKEALNSRCHHVHLHEHFYSATSLNTHQR